jgi:hypothetical protein
MTDTPIGVAQPVEAGSVDPAKAFDPVTSGRPDPNVKAPVVRHQLDIGGTPVTAELYRAVLGIGEDVWQILHDGQPVVTVVADRIADAAAEHDEIAARFRTEAQALTARADEADATRTVIAALADKLGVDIAAPPAPAPPVPRPPHPPSTVTTRG